MAMMRDSCVSVSQQLADAGFDSEDSGSDSEAGAEDGRSSGTDDAHSSASCDSCNLPSAGVTPPSVGVQLVAVAGDGRTPQQAQLDDVVTSSRDLLKVLQATIGRDDLEPRKKIARILAMPFPIAVFGTLRVHHSNNHFMGIPCSGTASLFDPDHVVRDHTIQLTGSTRRSHGPVPKYQYWTPAAIRCLSCEMLRVVYEPKSHLMTELFAYAPDQFAFCIQAVDNLESFESTCSDPRRFGSGYVRTLCWVDPLPWAEHRNISHELSERRVWPAATTALLRRDRSIPAWVYSSAVVNSQLLHQSPETHPIIWCPHTVSDYKASDVHGTFCAESVDQLPSV